MTKKRRKNIIKTASVLLSISMLISQSDVFRASASDRQTLEEYLEQVRLEVEEYNDSLDSIYEEISQVNSEIKENETRIEKKTEDVNAQKEDMARRIQYMYEAGYSLDIVRTLFSTDSISEALNKVSLILDLVTFDRDQLELYVAAVSELESERESLKERKLELEDLKDEFEAKSAEANEALEEAAERLLEYDIKESEVTQVLVEYIAQPAEEADIESVILSVDAGYDENNAGTQGEGENVESSRDFLDTSRDETEQTSDESVAENASVYENSEVSDDSGWDARDDSADDAAESQGQENASSSGQSDSGSSRDESTQSSQPSSGTYAYPYSYTDSELYDLARITYLEVGSSYPTAGYYAVYLTACVILNRAANWYGGSINGAIYDAGQYSTAYKYTSWGGGELVINDITWQAVYDALSNCDPVPYYQAHGSFAGILTVYYTDPGTGEQFYY